MHHPFAGGWIPADIAVPLALFTGTADHTCSAASDRKFYDKITFKPRTWRNQVGINHLEPNPKMAGVGPDPNPPWAASQRRGSRCTSLGTRASTTTLSTTHPTPMGSASTLPWNRVRTYSSVRHHVPQSYLYTEPG